MRAYHDSLEEAQMSEQPATYDVGTLQPGEQVVARVDGLPSQVLVDAPARNVLDEYGPVSFWSEAHILGFCGFLTADIPELHNVHPQRLADSWERFKARAGELSGFDQNGEG